MTHVGWGPLTINHYGSSARGGLGILGPRFSCNDPFAIAGRRLPDYGIFRGVANYGNIFGGMPYGNLQGYYPSGYYQNGYVGGRPKSTLDKVLYGISVGASVLSRIL